MNLFPLWKRCRTLANGLRLDMLELLRVDSPQCVKEIAHELEISENVASKNLQLLCESGFLTQQHRGKYLFYLLAQEDLLLSAVLKSTQTGRNDHVIFMATALTHERRVAIVKVLDSKPLVFERVCLETRISREAMIRQIKKLERRGFVTFDDEKYALMIPKDDLGKVLVELVLKERTPAQVYVHTCAGVREGYVFSNKCNGGANGISWG